MRKQELERQQAMAKAAKVKRDDLAKQRRQEAKTRGEIVELFEKPTVGIKHRRNKWRWAFVPY